MTDFSGLEIWLFLQVIFEAVLVAFMVVFFLRLRRLINANNAREEARLAGLEGLAAESEQVSAFLTENLRQKKELSLNLLLNLERKLSEMKLLLARSEKAADQPSLNGQRLASPAKGNPAAPETRTLVLKLASRGQGVEEIARKARLHRGEVELILDLEKWFKTETAPG